MRRRERERERDKQKAYIWPKNTILLGPVLTALKGQRDREGECVTQCGVDAFTREQNALGERGSQSGTLHKFLPSCV